MRAINRHGCGIFPCVIWKIDYIGKIEIREIQKGTVMGLKRYIYWQNGDFWLGYLEEYPDYITQGETIEELIDNLKDIYEELTSGNIPSVRRVAELEIA